MRISMGIGHEPGLQRLVIASVVLHFILMAFLFIPIKTGDKEFKTYYVSLAEPAKVSGGGETTVRKAEEKPAVKKEVSAKEKKTTAKKEVPEKKDHMSLNERKSADKSVADKIKSIKDRKDINAAINALPQKKAEGDKTRGIEAIKNAASAKGGGGAPGKGGQMPSDSYYALITGEIRKQWEVPPDFDSSGLEVEISIKIDSKGNVVSKVIDKPSGNILFDQSALRAISKASPLTPPLTEMEIGMRFYP